MRRRTERVACRGPEVEGGRVRHDLPNGPRSVSRPPPKKRRTETYAVIPDGDVVWLPLVTYVEIVILRDLGKEEREDRVGLCLGNAY